MKRNKGGCCADTVRHLEVLVVDDGRRLRPLSAFAHTNGSGLSSRGVDFSAATRIPVPRKPHWTVTTKWSQSGRSDRRFRSAHTRRTRTDEEGCSPGAPPARRARAYRTIRPSSGRPAAHARRFGPLARRGLPPRRMRSRARRSIPLRLARDGSDQSGRGRPAVPQAASPP